jgi:hypothetical protein
MTGHYMQIISYLHEMIILLLEQQISICKQQKTGLPMIFSFGSPAVHNAIGTRSFLPPSHKGFSFIEWIGTLFFRS